MANREQLQSFDSNKGMPFEREEVILYDTIFFNPSATLSDAQFFNNRGNDYQYQNAAFPITSHAYRFTHARLTHTMAFTVADPLLNNPYLLYFEEYSRIVFTKENKILGGPFPFSTLSETMWHPAARATATVASTTKDKFASWYKFEIPIEVGAGKQFQVDMKAAKGLTLEAYAATITPYYPNATAFLTAQANRGYAIKLELRGIRWIEAGA